MNIQITGRNIEVTPAINDYIHKKLKRLDKHFDAVMDAQVVLAVSKHEHKAEITVHVPGKEIHSSSIEESMYAAIDVLADKIDRQVRKYKEKSNEHSHASLKHMESDE